MENTEQSPVHDFVPSAGATLEPELPDLANRPAPRRCSARALASCSTSSARDRVPQSVARALSVLPVSLLCDASGDLLNVISSHELTAEQIQTLRFVANADVSVERVLDLSEHAVNEAMTIAYGASAEQTQSATAALERQVASERNVAPPTVDDVAAESEMLRLLRRLVFRAHCLQATDLVLEPDANVVVLRYRIRGRYENDPDGVTLSPDLATRLTSCIKVLARLDITEQRRPLEGSFCCDPPDDVGAERIQLRVSIVAAHFGPRVAIRLFATSVASKSDRTLSSLGLPGMAESVLRSFLQRSHGSLLVCGPTGSGKTTLLYALLHELASENRSIVTIEDPVERPISGASQFELSTAHGLGYHELLKASMRQDPDVLLLGEIRESSTAETSLEAGLTGHLVLSTIHASSELDVLFRLRQFGITAGLIATSVKLIVSLRLVGKVCCGCVRERTVSEDEARVLCVERSTVVNDASGCSECKGSGIQETGVVAGYLPFCDSFVEALCEAEQRPWLPSLLRPRAIQSGYQPLPLAVRQLVLQGMVSPREARRVLGA